MSILAHGIEFDIDWFVFTFLHPLTGFVITGGGPLAGWLADVSGSFKVVFIFASILNLVGSTALATLLYLQLRLTS